MRTVIDYIACCGEVEPQVYAALPLMVGEFRENGYFEKVYIRLLNQVVMKGQFTPQLESQPMDAVALAIKSALHFNICGRDRQGESPAGKRNQNQKLALGSLLIVAQNFVAVLLRLLSSTGRGWCLWGGPT